MLAVTLRILLLVVVYDLHVVGVPTLPPKAHPPLIVDPDAVLPPPLPVSLQLLQAVARRDLEVVQAAGRMQDQEFAERDARQGSEPLPRLPLKEGFGIPVRKPLDNGV